MAEALRSFRATHATFRRNTEEGRARFLRMQAGFAELQALLEKLRVNFPGAPRPVAYAWIDAGLSTRQREILAEVVAGKANKVIAFELGLSEKTVETHRARAMAKLGAKSFADLLRITLLDQPGPPAKPPPRSAHPSAER